MNNASHLFIGFTIPDATPGYLGTYQSDALFVYFDCDGSGDLNDTDHAQEAYHHGAKWARYYDTGVWNGHSTDASGTWDSTVTNTSSD